MALLCFNKGCGVTFDSDENNEDSCLFHPGVPIFHDALKGWSCCRKRTTDFSDFLSIKGCTRGPHSNQKPQEPLQPEVSSDKAGVKHDNGPEIIYRGPKSAETLQKERPSSDEAKTKIVHKVSASLVQVLQKLDVSKKAEIEKRESQTIMTGTRCKNAGCKTVYQGPETDSEVCTHHPGGPVFHEGYKYWSCCVIKTIDFNAFLDQRGCATAKHRWVPKQSQKKVACRHDWHQTGGNVVVTVYAKNANPELTCIEANRTVLSCRIQFEDNKIFKRDFHLWGVVNVKQSSVNMVSSKVEITLRKADQVAWGRLEDPRYKPEPETEEDLTEPAESLQPDWDDDDISDSEEDWSCDPRWEEMQKKKKEEEDKDKQRDKEEAQNAQRKEVEEEMRKAMEERKRAEEEERKLQEQRRQEGEEGYEDMPELE